jgi:hypothetical protein
MLGFLAIVVFMVRVVPFNSYVPPLAVALLAEQIESPTLPSRTSMLAWSHKAIRDSAQLMPNRARDLWLGTAVEGLRSFVGTCSGCTHL